MLSCGGTWWPEEIDQFIWLRAAKELSALWGMVGAAKMTSGK